MNMPPPIPPSPFIPSPTTSSSPPPSVPSLDSPTNSNPIPPDTSVPLRHSTHTKQAPTWQKDYEMSSGANHLTSSSSPSIGTRYPLHHYLVFSRFSPTQCTFLALNTSQTELKTYDEAVGDLLWQQVMNDEIAALGRHQFDFLKDKLGFGFGFDTMLRMRNRIGWKVCILIDIDIL